MKDFLYLDTDYLDSYLSQINNGLIERTTDSVTDHKKLFQCEKVDALWRRLDCKTKTYNCNYNLPSQDLEKFTGVFNALSDDVVSKETIIKKVNQIPQFEMNRLCELVKKDMQKRNPLHTTTDEKEFLQQNASISYIALQEGIMPSVLYMIYIMNFEYIKEMA